MRTSDEDSGSPSKDTASGPPKKPMTPFFLFKTEEAEKGNKMNGKEAGKKWKELSEDKKHPYVERHKKAKEAYDKYLIEVEGLSPKKPGGGKPTAFNRNRVRAVFTSDKNIKAMDPRIYRGAAKILELFFEDMGKSINGVLKKEDTRTANLDIVQKAVETDPKFKTLAHLADYNKVVQEITVEAEKDKERKKKKKEAKSGAEDDDDSDVEKKKKSSDKKKAKTKDKEKAKDKEKTKEKEKPKDKEKDKPKDKEKAKDKGKEKEKEKEKSAGKKPAEKKAEGKGTSKAEKTEKADKGGKGGGKSKCK